MSPPCTVFPASELPARAQLDTQGRKRKPAAALDLQRDCVLRSMTQYECEIENPQLRNSPVVCYPFRRLFRECKDRNGSFLVETTPIEGGNTARNV